MKIIKENYENTFRNLTREGYKNRDQENRVFSIVEDNIYYDAYDKAFVSFITQRNEYMKMFENYIQEAKSNLKKAKKNSILSVKIDYFLRRLDKYSSKYNACYQELKNNEAEVLKFVKQLKDCKDINHIEDIREELDVLDREHQDIHFKAEDLRLYKIWQLIEFSEACLNSEEDLEK